MDREAWWATVQRVTQSDMTEQPCMHTYALICSICFPLSDMLHFIRQSLGPSIANFDSRVPWYYLPRKSRIFPHNIPSLSPSLKGRPALLSDHFPSPNIAPTNIFAHWILSRCLLLARSWQTESHYLCNTDVEADVQKTSNQPRVTKGLEKSCNGISSWGIQMTQTPPTLPQRAPEPHKGPSVYFVKLEAFPRGPTADEWQAKTKAQVFSIWIWDSSSQLASSRIRAFLVRACLRGSPRPMEPQQVFAFSKCLETIIS